MALPPIVRANAEDKPAGKATCRVHAHEAAVDHHVKHHGRIPHHRRTGVDEGVSTQHERRVSGVHQDQSDDLPAESPGVLPSRWLLFFRHLWTREDVISGLWETDEAWGHVQKFTNAKHPDLHYFSPGRTRIRPT